MAAFPTRLRAVWAFNSLNVRRSARWLWNSREHTNYTYDLTEQNGGHLAWFVANLTGSPVKAIYGFMDEIYSDTELIAYISDATATSRRSGLADGDVRFGRRVGWYAIVRSTHPEHVVETGTDKGLGSLVLAAALLRNGHGRLTTVDTNPSAGYLIGGKWGKVVEFRQGDSHAVLPSLDATDVFLHDSLHTAAHEGGEYRLVEPRLTQRAIVLSDAAHHTSALRTWAEATGRRFSYFQEAPADHWYSGAGIGVATQDQVSTGATHQFVSPL